MTDSIPALRRMLSEAHAKIRELESRDPEVKYVDRYVDRPYEVIKHVYKEKIKEVNFPIEVEKVVKVPHYIENEVVKYVDNPDHIEMIERLQEKCRSISQSDS